MDVGFYPQHGGVLWGSSPLRFDWQGFLSRSHSRRNTLLIPTRAIYITRGINSAVFMINVRAEDQGFRQAHLRCTRNNLINLILLTEHTEAQRLPRDRCNLLFCTELRTHPAVTSCRSWGARLEGFATKSHSRNGRGRSKTGCKVAAQGESQRGGQNRSPSTSPCFALPFFFKGSGGRRKEPSARNKGIPRSTSMQLENLKNQGAQVSIFMSQGPVLDVSHCAAVSATVPSSLPPPLTPPPHTHIPIWVLCII